MVEEDPSCSTYGEAYEVHCARTGREPDSPLNYFKRKCCAPNGQLYPELKIRVEVRAPPPPRAASPAQLGYSVRFAWLCKLWRFCLGCVSFHGIRRRAMYFSQGFGGFRCTPIDSIP